MVFFDKSVFETTAIIKICKFTVFSSGSFCQIYRVTDEAFIAETMVWPNFFLMNVFFALKGSKLFYDYSFCLMFCCLTTCFIVLLKKLQLGWLPPRVCELCSKFAILYSETSNNSKISSLIVPKIKLQGWLVDLIFNVPVNNFSVMLRRSHYFLGITSTFGE